MTEADDLIETHQQLEAEQLVDEMKSGTAWRMTFPLGDKRPFHVRAVVDDNYIVTRKWSRAKQRWLYTAEHRIFFEFCARDGHLEKVLLGTGRKTP